MIASLCGARLCGAQVAAAPDSSATADSTAVPDTTAAAPDTTAAPVRTLQHFTVSDTLGIPGTLEGQTEYDPREVKKILGRMGSDEVAGKTTWERKKNPRTAMLCSMVLPGLGQTYNGRRLKVGVMVGFASYYMGTMVLNWHAYQEAALKRDLAPEGSTEHRVQGEYASFYKEEARTYLWWSGAVWLLGLIDSWIDAHLYDVREYTPPPPPESVVPSGAGGGGVSYLTVGIGFSLK